MSGHSLSLGALGALGYAAALGAVPQHGPEAAPATAGDTRIVPVFEFLAPTGVFQRVSPTTFAELEAGFREIGDVNSLTSKLRWGDEQQTVGETRWSTSTLPEGRDNWFRPTAAQWTEYTESYLPAGVRERAVIAWAHGGRQRLVRIVRDWRSQGAVAWQYPVPGVVSQFSERVKQPPGRLALYLTIAAAGFFGWRVYQGREGQGGRASA